MREPTAAEMETIIIKGNKRLPLSSFTGMFFESVVFQILVGLEMMVFIPLRKNL